MAIGRASSIGAPDRSNPQLRDRPGVEAFNRERDFEGCSKSTTSPSRAIQKPGTGTGPVWRPFSMSRGSTRPGSW